MFTKHSTLAAGVIGGALLLFGAAPAPAATLSVPALSTPGETAQIVQVQRRAERRERHERRADRRERRTERRWERRRHGPRYRYARPGFRHYHGGYYYSNPWWSGPGFGFSVTVPGVALGLGGTTSAHVQWCLNRYRTYDPATDTYIPRVGERAYCNSPYR